jgi:hypothetical protein
MDTAREGVQPQPDDEVFSADDKKLGKVVAADARFLTVEHGLIGKSQYFIPTSAVNARHDGKVHLNVAKDAVASLGWDVLPPVATDADGVTTAGITPHIEGVDRQGGSTTA